MQNKGIVNKQEATPHRTEISDLNRSKEDPKTNEREMSYQVNNKQDTRNRNHRFFSLSVQKMV